MLSSGAWLKAVVATGATASTTLAGPLVVDLSHEKNYAVANPMNNPLGFKDGRVVPDTAQSDRGYYYFQAFPNSRVPTASITCIAIPVAFVLIFIAIVFFMRAWLSISSRFAPSLSSDREKALENLRVVGIRTDTNTASQGPDGEKVWSDASDEKHSDGPSDEVPTTELGGGHAGTDPAATVVAPAPVSAPPAVPIPVSPQRASEKKVKDANEISGPVVPVLRSDDPNALSDNEDDSYEEYDSNNPSRHTSAAPSEYNFASRRVSAAPSVNFPHTLEPYSENVLDLPKDSNELSVPELPPPIDGSAALPASISNATTLHEPEATETKDQNSLFP
ncbi:hypothetical protein MCAP1_000600 [Malassezia caprae]|uniref:Uncharacterized protein n=1 Tax=Malassezia caprae TaxID=1381934 RepID=A0AAF0IVC0_9BASI|nr:hypothetical protein MCAP1_000600 [Malassezia caprae]